MRCKMHSHSKKKLIKIYTKYGQSIQFLYKTIAIQSSYNFLLLPILSIFLICLVWWNEILMHSEIFFFKEIKYEREIHVPKKQTPTQDTGFLKMYTRFLRCSIWNPSTYSSYQKHIAVAPTLVQRLG